MRRIRPNYGALELTERERDIVRRITNDGFLRASRPDIDWDVPESGIAAYVWRMVVFTVSDDPKHQCLPVMADCYLPGKYGSDEYKAAKEFADELEKKLCDSIPKGQWAGVIRWGRALGMLETPTDQHTFGL